MNIFLEVDYKSVIMWFYKTDGRLWKSDRFPTLVSPFSYDTLFFLSGLHYEWKQRRSQVSWHHRSTLYYIKLDIHIFNIIFCCLFCCFDIIWATPCENMSTGICGQRMPRSDCASAQSDQGLRCPLTESLDTIECNNGKMPGWDSAHEWNDLNMCILRMLEDTFSLGAAHL